MKVVYVAKHNSGGNDDEGAVDHALEKLGHTVVKIGEHEVKKARRADGDFLLFHKWEDTATLKALHIPAVFWYFDLVDWTDQHTAGRSRARREWMAHVLPNVQLGFCTDGDWVARESPYKNKLVWLPQGADERVAGFYPEAGKQRQGGILFTGIRDGGAKRSSFVDEMKHRWEYQFHHVQRGTHGKELGKLIAGVDIVVAPDAPVTDFYWSNRVYLSLGFGAFMLHPYCATLAEEHYVEGQEIVYYNNRAHLHELIEYYLQKPAERTDIADRGMARTLRQHTYRHRCEYLVKTVKERLL